MSINNIIYNQAYRTNTQKEKEKTSDLDLTTSFASILATSKKTANEYSISEDIFNHSILSELKKRFRSQVTVKTFPKQYRDSQNFQKQLNYLTNTTCGTNNIVIAPNILEKMANDPEVKQYYMNQIQSYFNSLPEAKALLSLFGHEITSSGVIIHEDGTVSSWSCSDYTPAEKARLRRAMEDEVKAKAKAKAKKRAYQKLLLEKAQTERRKAIEFYNAQLDLKRLKKQLLK